MDILFNMRAFVCVAETGSFTAAAARLDLTTSYVSRAVATLETHLRTRLLHRTTRRIALTEAGQRYLMRCEQILGYIEEAEAEASDAHARPAGTLKVHAMTGVGQHYLIDAAAEYNAKYPDVSFDLTLANRTTDILDEGYDISVVIARELPDSGFVSQRLGQDLQRAVRRAELHRQARLRPPARRPRQAPLPAPGQLGDESGQVAARRPRRRGAGDHQPDPLPGQHRRCHERGAEGRHGHRRPADLRGADRACRTAAWCACCPTTRCSRSACSPCYPSRQYLDAKTRTWVEFLRDYMPQRLAADESQLLACSTQLMG